MGEMIRHTGNEIRGRWVQRMPPFFRWMVTIACGIGGAAVAINKGVPALGGQLHEWWGDAYTYIISTCIGVVFACKFTVAGGYKDIDPDRIAGDGKQHEMTEGQ